MTQFHIRRPLCFLFWAAGSGSYDVASQALKQKDLSALVKWEKPQMNPKPQIYYVH